MVSPRSVATYARSPTMTRSWARVPRERAVTKLRGPSACAGKAPGMANTITTSIHNVFFMVLSRERFVNVGNARRSLWTGSAPTSFLDDEEIVGGPPATMGDPGEEPVGGQGRSRVAGVRIVVD